MNKMTHDEMLKYSAELVIKNNPDEAVKLLVLLQKENELLKDRIDKAIEYIEQDVEINKYSKSYLLDILVGEDDENNSI